MYGCPSMASLIPSWQEDECFMIRYDAVWSKLQSSEGPWTDHAGQSWHIAHNTYYVEWGNPFKPGWNCRAIGENQWINLMASESNDRGLSPPIQNLWDLNNETCARFCWVATSMVNCLYSAFSICHNGRRKSRLIWKILEVKLVCGMVDKQSRLWFIYSHNPLDFSLISSLTSLYLLHVPRAWYKSNPGMVIRNI